MNGLRYVLLALSLVLGAAAWGRESLRIGYQKSSLNLVLLKHRGTLEKSLRPSGVEVVWNEFAAGPPMLEALRVGAIDVAMTGDTPPIFAQATGADLVYVGHEPAKPDSSALFVLRASPIRDLAGLKGKRIAFTKGSSAHFLVLKAMERARLQWSDITPVFLGPADSRAAFERGEVDAWAVWDPYYAAVEEALPIRVLASGRGLSSNHTFYLSLRRYAEQHGDRLRLLFEALSDNDRLRRENPIEVAHILAAGGRAAAVGVRNSSGAPSRLSCKADSTPRDRRAAIDRQCVLSTGFTATPNYGRKRRVAARHGHGRHGY